MDLRLKYVSLALIVSALQFGPMFGGIHHSTAAQYDVSKTINITGTISRLDWSNPHVHITIDAKANGNVNQHWDVELGSPGATIVAGFSKELLAPGTTVTVTGFPGKSGLESDLTLCAKQLKLANGMTATFTVGI